MTQYWVGRVGGIIKTASQSPTPDATEGPIDADNAELAAFLNPSLPSSLEFLGIVRFTVAANSVTVTTDTIDISAVLRVSAGRYRVYAQAASTQTLLPKVTVFDAAVKNARISARTPAYVEVKVVDGSNVAADAAEVILELNRIVTS